MFGALLLESSAGISLKQKKIIQIFELDRQKQTTQKHTLGTVFRQRERTKDTEKKVLGKAPGRPAS